MMRCRIRNTLMALVLWLLAFQATAQVPDSQPGGACAAWKRSLSKLVAEDQASLVREGVVLREDWIFSPSLIQDCDLRLKVAWYFRKVVQGQVDISVARFGWVNADAISSITRRVWPKIGTTSAVRRDGNLTSEAWALLRQPWIRSHDLALVLKDEIRHRGLSSEMVFLLLDRPLPEMRADIKKYAPKPAPGESVFIAAGALVLLDILGDDRAQGQLELLEQSASSADRRVLRDIVSKMSAGHPVMWSDLEPLLEAR